MTKINEILDNVKFDASPSVPAGMENKESKDLIDFLFSNNNKLLTTSGAMFELPHDTQALIAYFSGGEIIISRTHRYDGRVLAFLDLLSARNKKIKEPFYSDLGLISNIYKSYESKLGSSVKSRLDFDNHM